MPKFIAIFCLILAIAGTFYPCCMDDDCADESMQTGTHDPGDHREDKGPCSPFFACGSCAASVDITTTTYTICPPALVTMHYPAYNIVACGDYSSLPFLPPRTVIN